MDSFEQEIASHRSQEQLENPDTSSLRTERSNICIRERGCYITEGTLYSPTLKDTVAVLYSDPNIDIPKLTASHIMSPVGPSEAVGGQHGFPRWADYKEFHLEDGPNGEKRLSFQAKRSDSGLAVAKYFELSESSLSTVTSLHNPDAIATNTSLGEHLYFNLEDEQFAGLLINGAGLDDLLGANSENAVISGEPLYWNGFTGDATITLPNGNIIQLTADTIDEAKEQLGMLVWHRPGTGSICFEPTLGFDPEKGGSQLALNPYETVELSTKIELL